MTPSKRGSSTLYQIELKCDIFFIHAKRKLARSTSGKQEIQQNVQHQNNTTMSSSLMYSLSWQHAIE